MQFCQTERVSRLQTGVRRSCQRLKCSRSYRTSKLSAPTLSGAANMLKSWQDGQRGFGLEGQFHDARVATHGNDGAPD